MIRLPRVLLLEDDPSIRRFVGMALSDASIELLQAASIAEAKAVLATDGVALLIADLMLPDGSGMDLLADLQAAPCRYPATRSVIFSAGISAALREQAVQCGAWGVLEKPVSLKELVDCVTQALALDAPNPLANARAAETAESIWRISADQRRHAIDTHFGGRALLFDAFMVGCVDQLPADLQSGDAACRAADAASLRRVAHNLKSVLQLIGAVDGHEAARTMEQACAGGAPFAELEPQWRALRLQVVLLCKPSKALVNSAP